MSKSKSAYSIPTKKQKPDTYIFVVWVDNEAGVLARVVGLFSGRGYNIESLAVAEVDAVKNIICVKGATPGARGTWLVVEDSIKRNDIKEVEGTSVQAEKSTKKDK